MIRGNMVLWCDCQLGSIKIELKGIPFKPYLDNKFH